MFLKTHSLQQAPVVAHGGLINNHVKGTTLGVNLSTKENISAACSPLLVIFLVRKSWHTAIKENNASDHF